MAKLSSATQRPIPVNYTKGGQTSVRGVVVHIMAGTLAGTDSWFRNSRAQASSHFGTGKTGALYQWVDTADRAWAQASGNSTWLSVENEGQGGDTLTDAQMNCIAEVLAWAHKVYDVPLQVASSPSGKGLGYHAMGGSAWGGHTSCPGSKIVAQLPQIVARAQRLVAGQSIEEDPLAGMTKQDIYNAVWKTDAIPAPSTSSTIKTNPTWEAVSVLSDIANRVRSTEATVTAQSATIKTLAQALADRGDPVDVDALMKRITDAIESVTVRLDVDEK
ncbi:N-acetylmuramoyl-L-alanine amidase [Streptomyces sp. NBC_01016]|uniref:peptidoglycan recognition protein family protein n=1 Tax=Streptomyces sp. NBC_01016 TaxID=2903720 RepID=UPI00225B607D|nr:peptidoglycan recognition family protein [Streptomyces sp. NBC_01016]MCX4827195.1 N-acetylmuramoyl-L-alanine amidase [Streptomyces sp. NBC_01016]